MRLTVLAVALAALAAMPAAAQQAGKPSGAPFPLDVSKFNTPMGQTNGLFGYGGQFFPESSRLAALHRVCEGRSAKDRMTCNQAWREINAAYGRLHPDRVASPVRD